MTWQAMHRHFLILVMAMDPAVMLVIFSPGFKSRGVKRNMMQAAHTTLMETIKMPFATKQWITNGIGRQRPSDPGLRAYS